MSFLITILIMIIAITSIKALFASGHSVAAVAVLILLIIVLLATALHAGNVYKVVGQDSHGKPIYELDRVASSQAPAGEVVTTTGPSVTAFNVTMFALATAAAASEVYTEGHALQRAAKETGVEDATPIITFVAGVVNSVAGVFGMGRDE